MFFCNLSVYEYEQVTRREIETRRDRVHRRNHDCERSIWNSNSSSDSKRTNPRGSEGVSEEVRRSQEDRGVGVSFFLIERARLFLLLPTDLSHVRVENAFSVVAAARRRPLPSLRRRQDLACTIWESCPHSKRIHDGDARNEL